MEVLAAAWGWCVGVIEMKASMALSAQVTRLAEVVAEFSGGMFTPADFAHRAVDVDEALREIRERRRLDREERDARFVASEASRETEIVRLRDQLAEAHDYARREMVWVPASAGMSTSEQVADAMREETGVEVEPRPHSRSNVLDEVRGLGEQTERFDRAATAARPAAPEVEPLADMRLHIPGDRGGVRSLDGTSQQIGLPGVGFATVRWSPVLPASAAHWRIVANAAPGYTICGLCDSWRWERRIAGELFVLAGYKTPAEAFDGARRHTDQLKAAMDHATVASEAYLGETTPRTVFEADGSIDAEFKVQVPVAVIADMFPLAERIVCIDPHAMVDGEHERVLFVNANNGPDTYAQDRASVVCAVLPNGDINVLKNRRGQAGRWSFQAGVSFAEMVWTGSAWVPLRRPMGFAGDAPVSVVVGETEAGPRLHGVRSTIASEAYLYDVTGIDGPVPIHLRAPGWTGITWMSGRGRAKSLTVPGLQTRGDLGPNALRSAEMERLSQKTVKVLQRRDRLYAFHLPGGVKRYGHVDTWWHLRAGEPLTISIRPPEGKAVRQGIAWRRPGHDVDSFAEVPIRPTFDGDGGQVIEVRGELPGDLQHEIRQTSRDRLTITVTTANGAKITGPVTAWRVARSPECVVWHLTVPLRSPPPRT